MTAGAPPQAGPVGTGAASPAIPQVVPAPRRWPRPSRSWIKQGFFLVILLGLSVLFIYPFIWLISASLKPANEVFDNALIPHTFSWPYDKQQTDPRGIFGLDIPFARWIFNSLWIGFLGAFLTMLSSALVAFAFAYFRFPGRNFLFALILATMMLPSMVTMIPTYLIWNEIGKWTMEGGTVDNFLTFAILGHTIDLSPHIGTRTQYPLWMPNLFGSAFYIFLLRQFFLGIPRDLFEAARIDGDSYFSMFRRIALPLAKPALIVVFIFEVQAKWFDLMTPLIYLAGVDADLFTLPLGLKTVLDSFGLGGGGEAEWHIIMAGTVITVLPMIILFAIFQRYFVEGIATQGRKG
jgi:multiple sugar transport system permease protein